MLLARCAESASDFLETTRDEMAGTTLSMFRFCFIAEMFSALPAVSSFGQIFGGFLCTVGFSLFGRIFFVHFFSVAFKRSQNKVK